MRKIRITGGYSDFVVANLTDTHAQDLAAAAFKAVLVPEDEVAPDADDPAWLEPDMLTYPRRGSAQISLLVDEARNTPGTFFLHVRVLDNPTLVPVFVSDEIVKIT